MVGFGGMKSAAEPVICAGSSVQGALADFESARRLGASRLPELTVLFGFIVLLAFFGETVASVRGRCAVRRTALGDPFRGGVVGQPLEVVEELAAGLFALLPLGVCLRSFLDVSVVCHMILA
jgi:hypothetical protein